MMEITMNFTENTDEIFERFLFQKKASGLAEKTLQSYNSQFKAIAKHLDVHRPIEEITKSDLERMIVSMRDYGLAANTIRSYTRILKVFLTWCNGEGLTDLNIKKYKAEETIKETYSDEELQMLLKKPNLRNCTFGEYRSWVIVNFLVNSGSRAGTIRNILIKDIDFDNHVVYARHTKNKKALIIPLCSEMVMILKDYLRIRKGNSNDYLFCESDGKQLTENALRKSIVAYNHSRGLKKTSIHLFRHTFARKYLVDCGGNAFTLQKLLGHSTLEMTKHYCSIFDADIVKNYDNFSPLANMTKKKETIKMKRR